jgi:hypothetical protein
MKNVSEVFLQKNEDVTTTGNASALPVGDFAIVGTETGTMYATATLALAANDSWYLAIGSGTAASPFAKVSNTFTSVPSRVTSVAYAPSVNQVTTVVVGDTSCETEYLTKISFDSEEIAKSYGYNDLVETFSYTTGCCDDCSTDCPSGNCAELAAYMAAQINNHPYLTAEAIDITGGGTTAITTSNWAASTAACDKVTIAITGAFPLSQPVPCAQDAMQLGQTMGTFHVSLLGGFECQKNASTTVSTAAVMGQGYPYQIGNMVRWSDGYKRKFGMYRTPFPYGDVAWPNAAGAIDTSIAGYDYVVVEIPGTYAGANTLNPVVQPQTIVCGMDQATAGTLANVAAIFA